MSFQSKVFDITFRGLGVVRRVDGKNFFVPGVWPGDVGEFAVIKEEKKFGFAKLLKLVQPSHDRKEVECPHFGFESGQCGGCSWLMVKYDAQLSTKQKILQHQYELSGLPPVRSGILPIVPAAKTMGYRTRAQLKTDGKHLGYVTPQSKELAPVRHCLVLTDHNRTLLQYLHEHFVELIRTTKNDFKFQFFDLDESLQAEDIQVNVRRPFRQGHAGQNLRMKQILREWCDELKVHDGAILELFCGSGNLTEELCVHQNSHILALESYAPAIAELKRKGWSTVEAQVADLFILKTLRSFKAKISEFQTLVLDPPREGFELLPQWVDVMRKLERVIYISCDVQTFLRDAKAMNAKGWVLERLQPIDLYPQTPHLELMGLFVRLKNSQS